MKHAVLTPSVGESITEVSLLKWHKASGSLVKSGEVILEIESDKATVELVAEHDGVLSIESAEGTRVAIGQQIAVIDTEGKESALPPLPQVPAPEPTVILTPQAPTPSSGVAEVPHQAGPAARKLADEMGVAILSIPGSGKEGRVTKGDLMEAKATPPLKAPEPLALPPRALKEGERREPMSSLRQKIAERLVKAQHTAAILTTFNEVDLSEVMKLRAAHKEAFKAKHGASLGFMSFFSKAVVRALKLSPVVHAHIEGKDVIYKDFIDLGIAVGTERGLVVPVIRKVETLSFGQIESKLTELAKKARDGKLGIQDMAGGSFTITNGGVYGSLMSTPILNAPQSGILGMHKIQERPVVVDGAIVIRPMMYLALSYDHRLIDGKEAVTFLVQVKEALEKPELLEFSID